MKRRHWIGLFVVLAAAAAVVAGSLGHWVRGGAMTDSDVANTTERHWMVAAAVALGVVAVVQAVVRFRSSVRLGWMQLVAWLHLALIVGASTLDTSKKVGSSKPDLGDRLGWGLWLACAGTAVALAGAVIAYEPRSAWERAAA